MEETKNLETSEKHGKHHHDHKCEGLMCKCGPMGHKFVKLILAIFVVIILLSIGASFGRHHSAYGNYRYNDNNYGPNKSYDMNGGCAMHNTQSQGCGRENECQFNMMRGQAMPVGQAGFQVFESSLPGAVPAVDATYIRVGTSTPVNAVK